MAYDIDAVSGIDELRDRMDNAESDEDWSFILNDYISWGNNKVSKTVAIFNMNSATDCRNRNTSRCQVPDGKCYAYNDERNYGNPLDYRRRQEYLWDSLDAHTFASAFLYIIQRKRNPVSAIRLSEAGDFRHSGDVVKANRIAELLNPYGITVYTYSASSDIEWAAAETLVVNQSNSRREYGDRRFYALSADAELDDDTVWCPFSFATEQADMDLDERPKCGECRLCLNKEGPDVAIPIH